MNGADFPSYAEDNTSCVTGDSIEDVTNPLENDSVKLFSWFRDSQMEAIRTNVISLQAAVKISLLI